MAVFQNTSSNIVTTVADGTGTLSLVGNLWTSANAYIAGDLTVDGNVTYINISELNVEDPIISMGRGPNNTPLSGNDDKDRGIDMWYYTSSEKSSFVGYQNATGNIIAATDVTVNNEIVTVNTWGTVQVGRLYADSLLANSASIVGNIDAGNLRTTGLVTATGNVTGGNVNTAGLVTAGGNITGANINTAGLITAGGNITGANIITSGLITASGNIRTASSVHVDGLVFVEGLITAVGNVIAANFDTSGVVSAGGNVIGANINTAGLITASGNITGANVNTAGNVTGGNILTVGEVSAVGNITGAWLIGNGSQITSISSNALPLATKTARGAIVGEVNSEIALGTNAGFTSQGPYGIAIGFNAAANVQDYRAIAIGYLAGSQSQDHEAVAIGSEAGYQSQGRRSIAIGLQSGYANQGQYSIAMGFEAGFTNQSDYSIVLNAQAAQLNAPQSGLYIAPIRNDVGNTANIVFYNTTTKEVTYTNTIGISGNITGGNLLTGGLISASGNIYGSDVAGVIRPTAGTGANGIIFPDDPGGGSGDRATIQYYAPTGENTVLELAVNNDPGDTIKLNATGGTSVVGNITAGGVNTTDLSLSGNVISAINSTSAITTSANITGGNIGTAGDVSAAGNVFGSVDGYPIGYRTVPQVLLTANSVAGLTDVGKHYYSTSNVDVVLTIANNTSTSWLVGSTIDLINQGTGNILVEQAPGVSLYLNGNSTAANRSVASYGMATLINVAPDTWFINGSSVS